MANFYIEILPLNFTPFLTFNNWFLILAEVLTNIQAPKIAVRPETLSYLQSLRIDSK